MENVKEMPFDSFSFSSFNNINAFPSSFSFFLLWIQTTITWWLPLRHDERAEMKFPTFPTLSNRNNDEVDCEWEMWRNVNCLSWSRKLFFLFSPFQFLFHLLFTRSTKQTQAWAFFAPFSGFVSLAFSCFRLSFTPFSMLKSTRVSESVSD